MSESSNTTHILRLSCWSTVSGEYSQITNEETPPHHPQYWWKWMKIGEIFICIYINIGFACTVLAEIDEHWEAFNFDWLHAFMRWHCNALVKMQELISTWICEKELISTWMRFSPRALSWWTFSLGIPWACIDYPLRIISYPILNLETPKFGRRNMWTVTNYYVEMRYWNLKGCGDLGDHAIDGGDHDVRDHRVAEGVHRVRHQTFYHLTHLVIIVMMVMIVVVSVIIMSQAKDPQPSHKSIQGITLW